jgi:hypothetical protein
MGLTQGKPNMYDFKKYIAIEEPQMPIPITELELSIMNNGNINIMKHCTEITNNAIIISIMTDRQKTFDLCMTFLIELFTCTKNSQVNLNDISKCCGLSPNIHYFKTLNEMILQNMDTKISLEIYQNVLSIAAKKGNINLIEYMDSINMITQNLLLLISYGAIAGDHIDILRWVFNHKHKIDVYNCLLDACVYLNRIDMFREFNKYNEEYYVDDTAMNIVLKEKRYDMFLEIINHNYSPKKYDEDVLDYCMELNMRSKMVDLIIMEYGDRVEPEPKHIRYIAQDMIELERLVFNYKSKDSVILDILCYALNDQNVIEILELTKTFIRSTKNVDILPSELVMLASCVRDKSTILKILTSIEYCTNTPMTDENINDIAYAIGYDSNIVLLDILINTYKFKINKNLLYQITVGCNAEMFVAALKNTDKYKPSSIIDSLIYKSEGKYKISDIEMILETILEKYPSIELSDFDIMGIGKFTDTELIDIFVNKLKLTYKHLVNIIKYKTSDTCFYHICRSYLKNQSLDVKSYMAKELKYCCDDLLKQNFQRLVFLIEDMDVPLEFCVLQTFGKDFDPHKWLSILPFDNDIDNFKKQNVTYEQIDKFIRLCTERSLASMKIKFIN